MSSYIITYAVTDVAHTRQELSHVCHDWMYYVGETSLFMIYTIINSLLIFNGMSCKDLDIV